MNRPMFDEQLAATDAGLGGWIDPTKRFAESLLGKMMTMVSSEQARARRGDAQRVALRAAG